MKKIKRQTVKTSDQENQDCTKSTTENHLDKEPFPKQFKYLQEILKEKQIK